MVLIYVTGLVGVSDVVKEWMGIGCIGIMYGTFVACWLNYIISLVPGIIKKIKAKLCKKCIKKVIRRDSV